MEENTNSLQSNKPEENQGKREESKSKGGGRKGKTAAGKVSGSQPHDSLIEPLVEFVMNPPTIPGKEVPVRSIRNIVEGENDDEKREFAKKTWNSFFYKLKNAASKEYFKTAYDDICEIIDFYCEETAEGKRLTFKGRVDVVLFEGEKSVQAGHYELPLKCILFDMGFKIPELKKNSFLVEACNKAITCRAPYYNRHNEIKELETVLDLGRKARNIAAHIPPPPIIDFLPEFIQGFFAYTAYAFKVKNIWTGQKINIQLMGKKPYVKKATVLLYKDDITRPWKRDVEIKEDGTGEALLPVLCNNDDPWKNDTQIEVGVKISADDYITVQDTFTVNKWNFDGAYQKNYELHRQGEAPQKDSDDVTLTRPKETVNPAPPIPIKEVEPIKGKIENIEKPNYKKSFNDYKEEKKKELVKKFAEGVTNDMLGRIISIPYDEEKSLDGNKAAVDTMVTQIEKELVKINDPLRKIGAWVDKNWKWCAGLIAIVVISFAAINYFGNSNSVTVSEGEAAPSLQTSWRVRLMNGEDVNDGATFTMVAGSNSQYNVEAISETGMVLNTTIIVDWQTGNVTSPDLGEGKIEKVNRSNKLKIVFDKWIFESVRSY